MNELAMGPLAPRISTEKDGCRIFRCGLRSCPETLARLKSGYGLKLEFMPGYAPGKDGVFIKNRRAASRFDFHQRNAHYRTDPYEEMVNPKTNDEIKRDQKAQELVPYSISGTQVTNLQSGQAKFTLEAVIRCARCGRSSKITEAECEHF